MLYSPKMSRALLVCCLRNNMYFAGDQLAVFQGANEAPLSEPCRRLILIATKCMLFRRQDTSTRSETRPHCPLVFGRIVILYAEIGVIKCSDLFHLRVG